MASLQKSIEIIFGGQDETGAAFKSINRNFNQLDTAVQGIAEPLAGIGDSILSTTAKVGGLAAAFGAVATKVAGDFDSGVREIGTLFNATQTQIDDLSESLNGYSRSSTATMQEIKDASYIAVSTGTNYEDLTQVLQQAEELSVASATSLTDAMSGLSRSLNSYGASSDEAKSYAETLFTVVQNGDTTMTELASNIGQVTTIASSAGVDFESLGAAISAVTIAGVKTPETMTLLKAAFKELANPSASLSDALGGMSLKTNSLQEIMQQLNRVTGGSFAEMNKLFPSVEATQAALILAKDSAGAFGGTLDALSKKTGGVKAAFDSMSETVENNTQKLINNMKATLVDVGTPLIDNYGDAVSGLNAVLNGLGEGVKSPNFQKINDEFDGFTQGLEQFLIEVGTALPEAMEMIDFDVLINAITDLFEQFGIAFDGVFGSGLDLTDAEDLGEVLQVIVNVIANMVNVVSGMVEYFQPFFEAIGQSAQEVSSFDDSTSSLIGNILGAAKILSGFGTLFGALALAIKESDTDIQSVFDSVIGGAQLLFYALDTGFRAIALVITKIAEGLATVFSAITFGDLSDEFEKSANELGAASDKLYSDILDNSNKMGNAWDKIGIKAKENVEKSKQATDDQVNSQNKLSDSNAKVVNSFDALMNDLGLTTEAYNENKKALDENQKSLKKQSEETKTLADRQKEQATQVKSILDDLDINKVLEAQVKLDIANIEANAKIAEATIKNLETVFKSTGDVLGDLLGQDWSKMSSNQQAAVRTQIRNEDKMRRESFELQKQLTEAQIENLNANTDRLNSGDAMISISADGLEPELEAFMWQILDRIKLKATQDQANFLLGL